MQGKTVFSLFFLIIFGIVLLTTSCLSIAQPDGTNTRNLTEQKRSENESQNATRKANEPFYQDDGGKGIVIAVPAPVMENGTATDKWIPQLFQDLITGDFARYSAMTVLDRANEQLVLAEQQLSMSGNYADEDYICIGRLTNAAFIIAGRITNIVGRYSVSFRITSTETNEIKTSFNKSYPLTDIETGFAAKETVMELLAGLGVELTEAGKNNLLAIPEIEVRSTAQLAKGMASEKDGNLVDALAFFIQAVETNPGMREADNYIQNFAAVSIGGSIRERANYARTQIDQWNKIFTDLEKYLDNNLVMMIYDLSVISDNINMKNQTVSITVSPGIKIIPNRTALLVWQKIMDEWRIVSQKTENEIWANPVNIKIPNFGNASGNVAKGGIGYVCHLAIGLYDDYGDRIKQEIVRSNTIQYGRGLATQLESYQPKAQHKYYEEIAFEPIVFSSIPLKGITDSLALRIEKAYYSDFCYDRRSTIPICTMSVAEWEQWLAEQGKAN